MQEDISGALRPGTIIDSDHPEVRRFAERTAGEGDARERAVRLYYAVRDQIRYDAYRVDLSEEGLKASRALTAAVGWCVPKAALLAAACRAVGIPARFGMADVRNHLSTERLRQSMGTDMFYRHGYTSILLGGKWVKATPAFNVELCHKLRLHPLEFDGTEDSIYHPFSIDGSRHMEYVAMRGEHDDVPRQEYLRVFATHYPGYAQVDTADWEADVLAEMAETAAGA